MGLRQQKRDRTEDAIVTAAYRLFDEQGYDGTTVEEIAAASDISPRTFYRYFESKDTTLAINGFRSIDRMLDSMEPDPSIHELVHSLADAIAYSLAHEHGQVAVQMLVEHPGLTNEVPVWRARWADYLAAGMAAAAGRDRPSASDRLGAAMAITITGLAVDERIRHGGDLSELAEQALDVLDAGFLVQRGGLT